MKLALVLLMSAVGLGQAIPTAECKGNYCDTSLDYCKPGSHVTDMTRVGSGYSFNCQRDKPKPRKPSVKTDKLHWTCLGDCMGGAEVTTWYHMPFNTPDPCDGIACTGPVEMLPRGFPPEGAGIISVQDKAAVEGSCFRGNIDHENKIPCPDKAAVPVERELFKDVQANRIDIETYTGAVTVATVYPNPPETMVKLSDSEYSHLQQLRASVVEEEKRLAVKYGATVPPLCSSWPYAIPGGVCEAMPQGPHYEFHGQFLLIDKGGK